MKYKIQLSLIQCLVATSTLAQTLNSQLEHWKSNTKSFMEQSPLRFDKEGKVIVLPQDPQSKEMRKERMTVRDQIIFGGRTQIKAAPDMSRENPSLFLQSGLKLVNIFELDKEELKSASSKAPPWSGDYWAVYKGGIGARFGDQAYPSSIDWEENFSYVNRFPASELIKGDVSEEALNLLSPAEKFDLITNSQWKLSESAWAEGKKYQARYGRVDTWMGICHGWAAASYFEGRPMRSLAVPVPNLKLKVTFTPSDIKALTSQMWAKGQYSTKFLGGRCEETEIKVDETTGRILTKDCFDLNPMSWHLSVVHEIGMEKRPLILDVSEDYQVWNQPAFRYNFSYFNPISAKEAENLNDAVVLYKDWSDDPFKPWRNPNTVKVVGIAMDLSYRIETAPTTAIIDSEYYDQALSTRYIYDLELDEQGNIIGGEWYQSKHPDFIWTPRLGSLPRSISDSSIQSISWDPEREEMPKEWQEGNKKAARQGQIPRAILERLLLSVSKPPLPQ
jgi:hypothetical protein